MYDKIVAAIHQDYPNSCVLWIEEVHNPPLRAAYEARVASILEKRGQVQQLQLYHGTKEMHIKPICDGGFDVHKNVVSAFGKGSYFSTSAMYSKSYAQKSNSDGISFMLVCDVAVGTCCVGRSNMVIDTTLFDNAIDNPKKTKIYVSPYNDGAYPAYVVAFYKDAPL